MGILVKTDSKIVSSYLSGSNPNQIESDDTIPESNEGIQVFYLDYTPAKADNILYITYFVQLTPVDAGNGILCVALFKDSDTYALSSSAEFFPGTIGDLTKYIGWHKMIATSTVQITYKVKIGSSNSGGMAMNGDESGRLYGGSLNSGIIIQEVSP